MHFFLSKINLSLSVPTWPIFLDLKTQNEILLTLRTPLLRGIAFLPQGLLMMFWYQDPWQSFSSRAVRHKSLLHTVATLSTICNISKQVSK